MASSPAEVSCFHCGAKMLPREAANGWCDSCGKRLPSWVEAEAKRSEDAAATSRRGDSSLGRLRRGRLLWGTLFLILLAAVVLVVLTVRGTIVLNFSG
jgi:hypothetical protein